MELWGLLLLALLTNTLASDESCMGRCESGFDSQKKCQCDSMCKYYKSCCSDFEAISRGDTFEFAEDDDYDELSADTHTLEDPITTNAAAEATTVPIATATTVPVTTATTVAPDPDAEVCSGRPFDAFMQFKNGSIYAFRGDYFFELDQKSVIPGYPKLIKDVWGITGPIDAAFTRINCQGKTYIFKGNKYWRFDNGMLEDDYPRDISVGFDRIPDHVDAAFALPAHSHHGKEKVYFFKGDQYYVYEFLHQPSHEECIKMSESSPSTPFRRYTDVYYSNYERFFMPQHHGNHHFINKDWKGLRSPVDAAMAGRIYISPWRSTRRRYNYQQGQQWGQRRQSRSPTWISFAERWDRDWDQDRRRDRYGQNNRGNYDSRDDRYRYDFQRDMPIQTVYFFKGDKYYRVDLRTKRVDPAVPPYPRSIAKYWLGCSDPTGAEK
uniref:Vitronectin a n=1 Tax=Amphilophus citrinellus TaxID=61819 RepID=A0A3Q0SK84_AMPCI